MTANLSALGQKATYPRTYNNNLLQYIPCICYPIQFADGHFEALINSENEVNAMTYALATFFGLTIIRTNVGARKIDDSSLKTYRVVLARFFLQDSLGKIQLFEKTFMQTKISMKLVLKMSFLAFSNINVKFDARKLI